MPRAQDRKPLEMRPLRLVPGVNPYAEGACLATLGETEVLCTATVEQAVPEFLQGQEQGWVTAEYAMLPRATHTRTGRDHARQGRAREISRLIGRSLRAAVDLSKIAGLTVRVDCDVLVADGGTRCASIIGGWVALALALKGLGKGPRFPVAALSLGRVKGQLLLDLDYSEDSRAELDLNLVLSPGGQLVEVQGTGEKGLFNAEELAQMVAAGIKAAEDIFAAQRQAVQE